MQYSLVGNDEGQYITVFVQGRSPLVAQSSHPNFSQIVEKVMAGDESAIDLFDAAETAAAKFRSLSDRVSVANGNLYLDGDMVHNALATQVVRFIGEGVEDWKPLVAFFENVQSNPQEHSREQLYTWLDKRDFTITDDGLIVGYKSVYSNGDGTYRSTRSGKAIVDGEEITGHIPNKVGSVIEMPRSEVTHDPSVSCHQGLHVGSYDYASTFDGDTILEVHVNPRDVVSVPTDSDWAKVRVCRYTVINTIEKPYSAPVIYADRDTTYDDFSWGDGENDGEYCGECGGDCPEDECYYNGEADEHNDDSTEDELLKAAEELGIDLRNDGDGAAAGAADDTLDAKTEVKVGDEAIRVGDYFEDRDTRRSGRTFRVDKINDDGTVTGRSFPLGLTRNIKIDRLLSRKYKRAGAV